MYPPALNGRKYLGFRVRNCWTPHLAAGSAKGEVRKAEAMFRAMLEWRHSFGVDVPSLETEDEKSWFLDKTIVC